MEKIMEFENKTVKKINQYAYYCEHSTGEIQIISLLQDKHNKWRVVLIDNFTENVIYILKNGKDNRPKETTILKYFAGDCSYIYNNSTLRFNNSIKEYLIKYFGEEITQEYIQTILDEHFEINVG